MLLSTRSPVFRQMFAIGMQEAKQKRVSIEDFDADVVEQFIHYTHTGLIDEASAVSMRDLLKIADKYDVPGLKIFAQEQLAAQNNIGNVCDTLELAMLIADTEKLRNACAEFIQTNETALKSTGKLAKLSENAKLQLFQFMHGQ